MPKRETISERIQRIANHFIRTRTLDGWFEREIADMTPIGIAWLTSQVMLVLLRQEPKAHDEFIFELDMI